MKILGVVPARGGSKGLPRKNIKMLMGKPLIEYTLDMARELECLDRVVVSTEDVEIARVSMRCGVEVLGRPPELAEDTTPMKDVLFHVIGNVSEDFDVVVLLEPTSPLRSMETVDKAVRLFCDKFEDYDSLVSLFPIEGKIGRIKAGEYVSKQVGGRRQDTMGWYRECGVVYVFKASVIQGGGLFGGHILPFVVDSFRECVDIDTVDDFRVAECFLTGDLYG